MCRDVRIGGVTNPALLVPDPATLKRKLERPPPMLAACYARFRDRLASDVDFRRDHVFLPALLGDPAAIAEARARILLLAGDPHVVARKEPRALSSNDRLNKHVWCVAPRAMRVAVYFTWLDLHGAWTRDERLAVGNGLLDFFDDYVVPVLRARVPGGHNQQFSMTFCSAVVGQALADTDGLAPRARALRDWGLFKLKQTLGLLPAHGYSGEGSTYQSDVVTPLAMWAGVFLEQLGQRDVWDRPWPPNGWRISDTLRVEAHMGGCGGLLPPWDNYGWQRIHNLAARSLLAGISGDMALLRVAEAVWDQPHNIAWLPDDRLWSLIYWPEQEDEKVSTVATRNPAPILTGWSLSTVGAAIEHLPRRLRVMAAWDACADGVQSIGREQVNPNHLIVDLGGEPITGDGAHDGVESLFTAASVTRTLQSLTPVEQEMIVRQYGSLERWVRSSQCGLIGASGAIIVDGWESYFPRGTRAGRLVFERRDDERHTFTGEAAAYYQPAEDVTRMRRTVSMNDRGVTWVVDDIAADTVHDFTWRVWLRREARPAGPLEVRLDLSADLALTLAWTAEADGKPSPGGVALTHVAGFPRRRRSGVWPGSGSVRCDLTATGRRVRFAACLIPESVEGLVVRRTADAAWEAVWEGGSDAFDMPAEIAALPDPEPVTGEQIRNPRTFCDFDEEPFGLIEEPDAVLLAALTNPPLDEWRRTGAAMQALTVRGDLECMPQIVDLLRDPRQNYTVHSVAAWCLGRARPLGCGAHRKQP